MPHVPLTPRTGPSSNVSPAKIARVIGTLTTTRREGSAFEWERGVVPKSVES